MTSNGEERAFVGVLGRVVEGKSLVGEGVGSDRCSEAWFDASSFD